MHGQRVLVTGVDNRWGQELAARLLQHDGVEEVAGTYRETPPEHLDGLELVHADLRHDLLGRLIRGLAIDTVVHLDVLVDPRGAERRQVHETNLIGSLNLLAACAGGDSPVRRLVLRSSVAAYGVAFDDPSFLDEDWRRRTPPDDVFSRDLADIEQETRDFAAVRPQVEVTVLRLGYVLGTRYDTPFRALLSLPTVPTVTGFDPRMQFLHEDDALAVLERCATEAHPGVFNVAGSGVMYLSQVIARCGRRRLPIVPPGPPALMAPVLRSFGLAGWPHHLLQVLQFGRVVDTARVRRELGEAALRSTRETVEAFALTLQAAEAPAVV